MFKKILIANRGEIAIRIIRACKELGIETVAIHSTEDERALHVRFADESVCVGPAESGKSYLNVPAVIAAAEVTGVDAIHPGYGYLSENAAFAEICEACNITFIGPKASAISLMGQKATARDTAMKAGVPVIPGSEGTVDDLTVAKKVAAEIGYPVMVKAAAGGGGKGMRRFWNEEELIASFDTIRNEAQAAFGDGSVYIEKMLVEPKHIEVQIMADTHGNAIHLGERECSVQRRHQKLIEESPSPILPEATRAKMTEAALLLVNNINYHSVGTIEFLYDSRGEFYFIEMNTRIQVEHTVTECVTGLDLIKEQIRIAAGQPLRFKQEDIRFVGAAIECRINAEDPTTFLPSPGTITELNIPGGPGVRVDTGIYTGARVSPYYDSMIAKLIVHGIDREEALAKMRRSLSEFHIGGIKTTIPICLTAIKDEKFLDGSYSTATLDEIIAAEKEAANA